MFAECWWLSQQEVSLSQQEWNRPSGSSAVLVRVWVGTDSTADLPTEVLHAVFVTSDEPAMKVKYLADMADAESSNEKTALPNIMIDVYSWMYSAEGLVQFEDGAVYMCQNFTLSPPSWTKAVPLQHEYLTPHCCGRTHYLIGTNIGAHIARWKILEVCTRESNFVE